MISPKYSVIVPVFNSEATLEELYTRTRAVFDDLKDSFEMIFVEDGCRDRSWEVMKKIKASDPERITVIQLSRNFGQHNATFCGFAQAKGDWIITMDDDLQHPPEEIPKLVRFQNETEADLVYGISKDKKHSLVRRTYSQSFRSASKRIFKGPGKGSSFRLLNKQLVLNVLNHHQYFMFIDELFLWYTGDIRFITVRHDSRKHRRSGYTSWSLFQIIANILLFYTSVPLKLMVYTGLLVSAFSFLIGTFYLIKKIFFNVSVEGYTSLIVAILFSTGIILLSLGVIGEYISRIYLVQNRKPPYNIKKIL
jgi:glycosyltransferase involved in cell wall biosynthesis